MNDGLTGTYLVEPLVDGTFLTKRGIKGARIRTVLENATIWRVRNPEATREEFVEYYEKN